MQQVQNQLQSAMRKLPQAVQNQGVTVRKTGDTNILTLAFVSTDGSMDKQDIADYVASNIQDPLSRVNGVGISTPTVRNTQCASGSTRRSSTATR